MCSSHLHRVDTGDGVQEVVGFINDDHVASELNTNSLASWSMKESVVGENYKLHVCVCVENSL